MNKKKILEVAALIESNEAREAAGLADVGFNMMVYGTGWMNYRPKDVYTGCACGTVGCVAGFTIMVERGAQGLRDLMAKKEDNGTQIQKVAEDILEISREEGDALFLSGGTVRGIEAAQILPSEAAQVMRNFVETSNVDWSAVIGEERFELLD